MKNWFKIQALFLVAVLTVAHSAFAQTGPPPIQWQDQDDEQQQAAQAPAKPPKDTKNTMTVLTQETKEVKVKEDQDFLTIMFTPVGDVTWGIVKTSSDILGGGLQTCVDCVDGVFRGMLSPFGFKEKQRTNRPYDEEIDEIQES